MKYMKTIQKIFSSLGTLNTITVYINENESEKVKNILDKVEQYVNEIDDKFSIFKDTSEISNINKNAGLETTTSITQGKYTDGTYEGSGQGYRGTTTVSVKVSNGNISSITIESQKDDDQFFNKAKSTIINEIISSQSTDVQTVSGATMSSNGIIDAVANALGISYTNPNSQMQNNHGSKGSRNH